MVKWNQHKLLKTQKELNSYKRFESVLGRSFERPIKSLEDGYPEFAINWINNAISLVFSYWAKEH
ncbi:MAG: hypothetical protein HC803_10200 [Saprospiraceae bacterium]|nr:hypothetical protein [Saprospiraceae bacterium]